MMVNKAVIRTKILLTCIILILATISVSLLIYRKTLQADLLEADKDTLNYVMEQQKFAFASKLLDQKNATKIFADSLADAENLNEKALIKKLNVITKNSTFDYISYVKTDGSAIENTGIHLNIADREYFQSALSGETVVADPMKSKTTGETVIVFASPVLSDGRISAVLVGIYNAEDLSRLLMPSFNGSGYAFITTGSGEIIVKAEAHSSLSLYSNLLEGLDTVKFQNPNENNVIRMNVAAGNMGHCQYKYEGADRLMQYAPIGINDWYVFSVAPSDSIAPKTIEIMYNATLFMLVIVGLSVLVLAYLFVTQKRHYEELQTIAFVDSLTGVANRKRFKLDATMLLQADQMHYAFVILDIDKFKVLNDTLGYACGDLFLVGIANIIKQQMQKDEAFGRCDSDEFYLLLGYTSDQSLRARAHEIIAQVEALFVQQASETYNIVICVGIYVIASSKESINSISDKARHAHKLVKGKEESSICFYNEEIRNRILEEKEIENRMHIALKSNEFMMYLQPKYSLEDETISGAEALVRWKTEKQIIIYPDHFIPVFERNGFITKLDMYMLEKACQTIQNWIKEGVDPTPISINFSRLHLKNPHFVDDITAVVTQYQVPPELIEIELTESTMMHNEDVLIRMLGYLHDSGFTLSMDDFGSGYSSLGLLKNLPVDVIKLDKSFFVDCCEMKRAVTVISGIISIAKTLEIKTVAEGVETKDQVQFLKEMGCDFVQGFYYAKPMPVQSFNKLANKSVNQFAVD